MLSRLENVSWLFPGFRAKVTFSKAYKVPITSWYIVYVQGIHLYCCYHHRSYLLCSVGRVRTGWGAEAQRSLVTGPQEHSWLVTEWGLRLQEISRKDGPARSQEVGRDGAGPGAGQQPLPGFLTALLFEAGSWTSRKWATSLPTKERKLLECFSSTSRARPGAGDGSPAKAAWPLSSARPPNPPPPTLVSGQLPLLSANPNPNPSSLHQQTCLLDSITWAPPAPPSPVGWDIFPHIPCGMIGVYAFNPGSRPGSPSHSPSFHHVWRQSRSGWAGVGHLKRLFHPWCSGILSLSIFPAWTRRKGCCRQHLVFLLGQMGLGSNDSSATSWQCDFESVTPSFWAFVASPMKGTQ